MRIPLLKSWLIFAGGFVSGFTFLAALLCLAYFVIIKPRTDTEQRDMEEFARHYAPKVGPTGQPQPAFFDFTAVGRNGKALDFREHRGRVVVLNVWATWCGPCMAELPSLGELAAHYAADTNVVVACFSEEPPATVFKNQKVLASGAPVYSLNGQKLSEAFDVRDGLPVTFIINPKGMIVCRMTGSANWAHPSVIQFIDSLRQKADTTTAPKQ